MEALQHHGVKGQRWGVRRNSNRPGGADGKEESTKVIDVRGKIGKRLDSMKRERQWHKVLKNIDSLTTKEIRTVGKRIELENSLKTLSKHPVAKKKDKEDYLRREFMSDAELSRKVTRLNAKKSLYKSVKDASKEQREVGTKVVQVASSIGVKYALNRGTITPKDLFNEAWDMAKTPKDSYDKAKGEALGRVPNPMARDLLKTALKKIEDRANPPKS